MGQGAVTLCDPSLARVIPKRLRDEYHVRSAIQIIQVYFILLMGSKIIKFINKSFALSDRSFKFPHTKGLGDISVGSPSRLNRSAKYRKKSQRSTKFRFTLEISDIDIVIMER